MKGLSIGIQHRFSLRIETRWAALTFILLCIVCLEFDPLSSRKGWAQGFGKNKVTDQHFDWLIHRTEHFHIYYYPAEAQLVPIMADIAEEAYEKHSEDFEHEIADRTPLILYQSHKDFQEAGGDSIYRVNGSVSRGNFS